MRYASCIRGAKVDELQTNPEREALKLRTMVLVEATGRTYPGDPGHIVRTDPDAEDGPDIDDGELLVVTSDTSSS